MTPEELRKEFESQEGFPPHRTHLSYIQWLERRCLEQDSTIAELKGERDAARDKALEEAAKKFPEMGANGLMLYPGDYIVRTIRALASLRKSQEKPRDL